MPPCSSQYTAAGLASSASPGTVEPGGSPGDGWSSRNDRTIGGSVMAREEFLSNLGSAVGLLSPRLHPNGVRLAPDYVERQLRRRANWLTPRSVDGSSSSLNQPTPFQKK